MQINQKKNRPEPIPPILSSNGFRFRAYVKPETISKILIWIEQEDGKWSDVMGNLNIAINVAFNNFSGIATDFDPDLVLPVRDALFIKKNNYFLKVPFSDIFLLKAEGNYTEIHTSTEKHVQTIQLSKLMLKFPNEKFMRVHRSYIINIDSITGFEGNTLLVKGNNIPVSDAYREKVFQLFKTI